MITAPLTAPEKGMIVFSETARLMAKITQVNPDGFTFYVLNGLWTGKVENGVSRVADRARGPDGMIDVTNQLGRDDFAQVLSVTRNEYNQWYMYNDNGTSALINRRVDAPIPPPRPAPTQVAGPDISAPQDDEGPEPVHEAVLILSVLGQGESPKEFENWIASLSLEQLAREMDQGELVGTSRMVGAMEIPPEEVQTRLEEMGSDASFFERVGPAGKVAPVASRISAIRDQQGWNDGSMEHLAAAFIREAGLERAFLAHLEAQAAMENGYDPEGCEP
jgi:hypothetical protein